MKRFEFAITSLQAELYRFAGKAAVEYVAKGVPVALAAKTRKVKNIQRAIEILKYHPENKHV